MLKLIGATLSTHTDSPFSRDVSADVFSPNIAMQVSELRVEDYRNSFTTLRLYARSGGNVMVVGRFIIESRRISVHILYPK